jgi:phage tail protein X
MVRYRTKQGDTVDYIAWKYYGRQDNRIVETILEANSGLSELGVILPENTLITLPDIETPVQQTGVRLWD